MDRKRVQVDGLLAILMASLVLVMVSCSTGQRQTALQETAREQAAEIKALQAQLQQVTNGSPAEAAAETLPSLGKAQDFELTNQDGKRVQLSDFRGKVVLLNFIYTSCPDVCPLENFKFKAVRESLEEPLQDQLALISVSFDPLDTPAVLKAYAKARGFDVLGWEFLTGSEEEIAGVTSAYGIFYRLVESGEQEGSHTHAHEDETQKHQHAREFVHMAQSVLIDQEGMVRKQYLSIQDLPTEDIVEDVKTLLVQE
ncbi:MAG: SCO family protein [Anaerolineae bacterium]